MWPPLSSLCGSTCLCWACCSTLLPPHIPHGLHVDWIDSTWNGGQSTWIPHGMEVSPHGFHMEWRSVHMDSTWNGVHSTWIPHGMGLIPQGLGGIPHPFHM